MKKTVLTFGLIAGVMISVLMDGSGLCSPTRSAPATAWYSATPT